MSNRCTHARVQEFTEICLDCGRNIYESDEDYEASLKQDIQNLRARLRTDRISKLEQEKADLEKELGLRDDDNKTNW